MTLLEQGQDKRRQAMAGEWLRVSKETVAFVPVALVLGSHRTGLSHEDWR